MSDVIVQNDNIKTKPLLKLHPISENIYNTRRNEATTDWFKTMASKNYKASVRKDGTHVFTDFLGNTYFNNGRMMSSNGQMANYDYKSLKGNALAGEDLENWKTAMRRLRYKETTLPDGSTAFLEPNGTTYYNNGRMLDQSEPIIGTNFNKGKTADYDIMGRVKLGKSFRESDNSKSLNSWFTNAMLGMAMAEDPAAMTASGWRQNSSGDYVLDKVDDPGVEKLRNNLAILGTGVTAGIAAPVVGPAVVSEAAALKPFLPGIGKNMLAGMFGADVFNATTRAVTGQSFDDYMVTLTPIKDLPINQEWKYMIGGATNPGGWLGYGTVSLLGDDITRTVGKGLNFIGNTVKNNFADGIKYIGRKTNSRDLVRLGRYFKGDNRAARASIQTEMDAVTNLRLRIDDLLEQLYKDRGEIYNLNNSLYESMWANNRTMVSLYRLLMDAKRRFRNVSKGYLQIPMRYSFPRYSSIDLNKALDPRFNPKADLVQLKFLNAGAVLGNDGKLYLTTNSNFNLTEGSIKLPKFGTDEIFTFNITAPKVESFLPVTNLSTRNTTNISTRSKNVEAVVPEEYLNILNHNINYVLEQFPGAKVFGSAAGVTKAGLPHATNDIDFYILDSALKKYEQLLGHELSWKEGLEDLTKKVSLDNGKYGAAGDIDLNIIYTKPDGTIDFYKGRGLNLFRQLYPDEFQRAYRAAEGNLSKMHYPMDALKVLNKVSVKNTIMDAFESTKDKHRPRALWYLNHGDPDLVYDSLIQHGNSLVGGKMRHAPVTENDFLDSIKNRELLKRMNLKGLVNVEAIAENPKLMRNIFEYWWLNNTVLSRGTSIENMPKWKASELGVPHERDFSKYAVRNSTEWSGGTGGTASGTGLNTVFYGNSYGGVSGNDIYSLLQPMLYGYREGLNPNELIDVVLANFPEYHTLLKEPSEFKFNSYGEILGLGSEISPKDLDELGKLLKIRGIVGRSYGDSRYVGLLSPNTGPDDILFINPAYGRRGKYVSPASARSRDLIHYRPDLLRNPDIMKLLSATKHIDAANQNIKLEDLPLFRKLREYFKPYTNIDTDAQLNAVKSKIDFAQDMRRTLNNEYHRLLGILETLRYRDQMTKDKFKSRALPFTAMGVGLAGVYGMYNLVNNVDKLILRYYEHYDISPELQSILDKYENKSLKLRLLERWEKENKLKFK